MVAPSKQLTLTVGGGRIAVKSLLTACALLLIAGCGPSSVLTTLEQTPQGKNEEVLTWTASAAGPSSTHALRVGVELDPARMMGWTGKSVLYRTLIDVTVTGPDGQTVSDNIVVPLTEYREVVRAGEPTGQMTSDVAGEALSTGFYRVAPQRTKVAFKPTPGEWTISTRLRVGSGAATEPLKGIRRVQVEVLGPDAGLTTWTP